MVRLTEILKAVLFGVAEGITEWLPVSSTAHLMLIERLVMPDQPESFFEVFKVVIQLGAILAVVIEFWDRLWPFGRRKKRQEVRQVWRLWSRIAVACIPAGIAGLFLDDLIDRTFGTTQILAIVLIAYGVLFIIIETLQKSREFPVKKVQGITLRTALFIGIYQCLALIPGTSRSGATIIGAMLLGCSRPVAAEFSFYLGVPVIAGASLLKIVKHGFGFTGEQWLLMLVGIVAAFLTAAAVMDRLLHFIKRHDFKVFGWYRIVLGVAMLAGCLTGRL